MIAPPPAAGFQLVRYFTVASLAAFLLVAAALLYFEGRANDFFKPNLLYAIVLGLLALLYCALFLIVRHGQRIIDKQDFERKRAELALLRQKDLYDVLSQSNKAIVRLVDRDELFATVCRIAVEHGRFRFAWIGLIDNDDQRLKPVARYGEDAGYIDQLDVSGDGARALRRGLTGRMLLSGANVISNDLLNDPAMAPWREAARRAGARALAKFPIREGGAVVGAINLYAGEPGFFTEELVATLEEMANDVSFALDNYAHETARKQAVALLEKSEQRYRTIIHAAIDGFCIVDTEGRFLEMNDAYCRLLGYQREELLKMRIPDVDAVKTPEDIARHLREIVRKGYDHFVSRLRRKDGQLLDIEFSANLIPDPDGERLFVFMRDITERKRAQEAVAESETRYRSLFENMLHGFAHCRMLFEDNRPQDYIYLDVNIAFEKLTGLKNVVGKRATEVIPGIREAHPELFETYGRVALTGQPERFELYFKPLESWRSIAVYSTGEGTFVAIFDNITERKRADQELRDYAGRLQGLSRRLLVVEETERRNINRELHDRIGQSLSALNISLNIIRSQLPREALRAVSARCRDTQAQIEGMARQVRDVMADLHPPALDDYGLLAALHTYAESFGARVAVPITVHGEDLTPRLSLAAEMALFRVAQGALANAVTHARAKRIQVMLAATTDRATLTIADDGAGFDVARAALAHASWGLPIMRERAEAVGATLRIDTAPGRGTRVVVEIERGAA